MYKLIFWNIFILICYIFLPSCSTLHAKQNSHKATDWDIQIFGFKKDTLWYTDGNATYLMYTFKTKDLEKNSALRIQGTFPKAHYMSFNIYDRKKFASLESIYDTELKLGMNPIIQGQDKYTLLVTESGVKVSSSYKSLSYPKNTKKVVVILRYYLPLGDVYGSVDIPKIDVLNLNTNQVSPKPKANKYFSYGKFLFKFLTNRTRTKLKNLFTNVKDEKNLYSYRMSSHDGSLLANKDTHYLVMPIEIPKDKVALVRFKPPQAAKNLYDHSADMRYWSISLGDKESHNLYTSYHNELKVATDGFIYLAISEIDSIKTKSEDWNYMSWPVNKKLALIYRHLLTFQHFPYSMNLVPSVSIDELDPTKHAGLFIGQYSPHGQVVNIQTFLKQGKNAVPW